MALADFKIAVTNHAHEQYCKRVEEIDKDVLQQQITDQMAEGYDRRSREYIQLAGVWWVFEIREGVMIYITCYGKTEIDIPTALRWARLHNDRIVLPEHSV